MYTLIALASQTVAIAAAGGGGGGGSFFEVRLIISYNYILRFHGD